jgi:hypothetical protein
MSGNYWSRTGEKRFEKLRKKKEKGRRKKEGRRKKKEEGSKN